MSDPVVVDIAGRTHRRGKIVLDIGSGLIQMALKRGN
jgi:hypothetical protein